MPAIEKLEEQLLFPGDEKMFFPTIFFCKVFHLMHISFSLKRLLSKTRELAAALLCLYTSIAAVAVQQDMSPYVLVIFISQPMASFLNLSHLT